MTRISDIITTRNLEQMIKPEVNYPGHVDLIIAPEHRVKGDFIVLTAEAAGQLAAQMANAAKEAYARAEREHPLFKEDA
jgi:hypothetical protein